MAACGYEFYFLVPEILSALEDKIRIPAWPCNMLYTPNANMADLWAGPGLVARKRG